MRLLLCIVLLNFLEFSTCLQQSNNTDVSSDGNLVKILQDLLKRNEELIKSLDNAEREVDHFLIDRNQASAETTIMIVRDYIVKRENFIEKMRPLPARLRELNLSDLVKHRGRFFNVTQWMIELNQTRKELVKLSSVSNLYKMFLDMHRMLNMSTDGCNGKELSKLIQSRSHLLMKMQNFTSNVSIINNFIKQENLTEVLTNDWIEQLLNSTRWEHEVRETRRELYILKHVEYMRSFIGFLEPCLSVVIFVIGFIGNCTILVTFARHLKIRKYSNMIILNLAIADLVSLVINLPVFFLYRSRLWLADSVKPHVFMFSQFLCFGLSILSTLALCLQRFSTTLKLSVIAASILRQSTRKSCLTVLATVWTLSVVFALPHGLYADIKENKCLVKRGQWPWKLVLFDMIVYCIVPLVIMILLSIVTISNFKLRALRIPDNIPDSQKTYLRKVLARSTKVVILSPIVFAISFFPYVLLHLLQYLLQFDHNTLTFGILRVFTYCLIFINSCYNPVSLYVVSGTFRHYLKTRFASRKLKDQRQKEQIKLRRLGRTSEIPL